MRRCDSGLTIKPNSIRDAMRHELERPGSPILSCAIAGPARPYPEQGAIVSLRASTLNIDDAYLAGGLQRLVLLVEVCRIDEASGSAFKGSCATVNMPEEMYPGLLLLYGLE